MKAERLQLINRVVAWDGHLVDGNPLCMRNPIVRQVERRGTVIDVKDGDVVVVQGGHIDPHCPPLEVGNLVPLPRGKWRPA